MQLVEGNAILVFVQFIHLAPERWASVYQYEVPCSAKSGFDSESLVMTHCSKAKIVKKLSVDSET